MSKCENKQSRNHFLLMGREDRSSTEEPVTTIIKIIICYLDI